MRSSRVILALLSPVLLIAGMARVAQAQVEISDHTLQFGSLSSNFKESGGSAPARQLSFKSYSFVVGDKEDLNDFRSPDPEHPGFGGKLRGARGIGRLLLLIYCSAECGSKDPQVSRQVWINESANPAGDEWKKAASVDGLGLTLLPTMFENPKLEFAVNGSLVHPTGGEMHMGNSSISHYYIQLFERTDSCRRYQPVYGADSFHGDDDGDSVSIDLPWRRRLPQRANGIVVGAPKVYDSYALQALRNDTLRKIQEINPFVPSAITGAYGNLQGVTRDQSYLNVQGQGAAPSPSSISSTDQTVTCPAGYYPAGNLTCAPISSGATGATPLSTIATSQTTTPSAALTPTVPAAPVFNPLATPGTVGQSSSDVLVEQVQLSAQLQIYQLLLEGAQSDALLVQNSRAVATRAQTTIGFPISIDPPRQFRHAVAEVRVLIEPFPTPESGQTQPVSIANLLPAQKTYNVAKITSKQRSFGGAAVIEPVASVGVSTGKAKDRLYLAKDTDTVALQYDHPSVKPLRSPLPGRALTGLQAAVRMQRLDECGNEWFAIDDAEQRDDLDSKMSRDNSVTFGWQFRPVLGADYVASGPRQVFAQLALPEALEEAKFLPAVLVQTRWREYDEKRQVAGPVFHSSCSLTSIKDPVIIENALRVHDTTWDDIGNGMLKIRAHGSFFSAAISMQSGGKTYSPVTFDGHDIEFFAPAKDLLMNGEIGLRAENSRATSLTIPLAENHAGCGIADAKLWAIPQADGTARIRLTLTAGEPFEKELDRSRPLVLIGSDVYGLKDKPLQKAAPCDDKGICVYQFLAPADSLRAASNYYVRDLSWSDSNVRGHILFAPFLSKMSKYSEDPPKAPVASKSKRKQRRKAADPAASYMLAGSNLNVFSEENQLNLKAYSIDAPLGIPLSRKNLLVLADSEALLTLPRAPKGKTVTIAWTPSQGPLSQEAPIVWDLTLPGQESTPTIRPTPPFLYAGDSRTVTYTGSDFSTVQLVRFEIATSLPFKVSPDDPTSMDVFVPSAITKDAGHKELIAITKDKKGKVGQLVLPIDIFKR